MSSNTFIYVTYIRATPEKVWEALTKPEFNRQYWFGSHQESDWKPGSTWTLKMPDGRVADAGEVLECDPPRRIVLKWSNEFRPELKAEGYTRCTFEIEEADHAHAERQRRRHPPGRTTERVDRQSRDWLAEDPVEPQEPARNGPEPAADRPTEVTRGATSRAPSIDVYIHGGRDEAVHDDLGRVCTRFAT
jgi:uncharacterized protein YndB with AHSA1/START domain